MSCILANINQDWYVFRPYLWDYTGYIIVVVLTKIDKYGVHEKETGMLYKRQRN